MVLARFLAVFPQQYGIGRARSYITGGITRYGGEGVGTSGFPSTTHMANNSSQILPGVLRSVDGTSAMENRASRVRAQKRLPNRGGGFVVAQRFSL